MVEKRHYREVEEEDFAVQESKRPQTLETVVRGLLEKELLPKFESLTRRVVREEFERVIAPLVHLFPRSSLDRINASEPRRWQLHFRNKLPHTLFTGNKIETEDGEPLQIIILDSTTKRIATTGSVSSLKVEILVLDGDFGSDSKEDWSEDDFNTCMIRERDGKRPLVTGDLQITLRDGIGYLGEISFTDNSSWTRSRTFRLGARVVSTSSVDVGIREARSEAFVVKDHRGELYKKHYPPSLGDEVWRLDKIGKDGAFHNRLASYEVNKVRDFLRLLVTKPSYLQSILGRMSKKTWETITQHAKSCILDNNRYRYHIPGRQVGLIFDSIYNLVGATFGGQSYQSLGNLTAPQLVLVEGLKRQAYENINDIVEISCPLVNDTSMILPLEGSPFSGSSLDSPLPEFPVTRPGQPAATRVGLNNQINAHAYAEDHSGQLEDFSMMQGICPAQSFSSNQRNSFKMKGHLDSYASELNQWGLGESSESVLMGEYFTEDADDHIQLSDLCSSWGHSDGFVMTSGDETGIGFLSTYPVKSIHMGRSSRPNMGWFKIWAAVKWMISVRRAMAARRRGRILWHPAY